ncbi:MAG: tryptophan 7-halogenase [Anaerolineales bacterium]|nr:tryptophan 7-halogenase [Anaerolineales bacterium]
MSQPQYDYDVAIIGGGPAGSSMAAYLAKNGASCVVYEREKFPRPHVGESFVPSSTRILRDLDFLPKMEAYKFPHKFGAVWTVSTSSLTASHDWEGLSPDVQADIRFEERNQPGVEQNYTYHVNRGLFDQLLLDHARELGATVFEEATVNDVNFFDDRVELRIAHKDYVPTNGNGHTNGNGNGTGNSKVITVKMVVDASGRRTFLGNRLKLKVKDPVFDQYAIHTWFEGFDRGTIDPTKQDYIYVHFLPITNAWIWQIPITDKITSIGVVTQKKNFVGSKKEREDYFWDCIASRLELYTALKEAKQIRPLTEEGDYSYAMTEITGDRWIMVGDAGRFVDPIFSTGVSIALSCSRFASPDILKAIETGDFSKASFSNYENTLRRGVRNWYEFISVYYRLNILFTAFINNPKYRLDVLKLLQGDVYEEEEPLVLQEMRRIVTIVENNPTHIWHKLLGDLSAEELRHAFN